MKLMVSFNVIFNFFVICILPFYGHSQNFEPYPIEIITDHALTNAFAGGLKSPQFSEMDLNLDGKKDLVIFEKASSLFIPMINNGSDGVINYTFDQNLTSIFPKIDSWMLLRDYNNDGLEDIFTGNSKTNGIELWPSKIINSKIQFTKLFFEDVTSNLLHYTDNDSIRKPIQLALGSLPEFSDVDGDGDIDILAFDLSETQVVYYKNLQIEKSLPRHVFDLILFDECFGKFSIDLKDSKIVLSDRPDECSKVKVNQVIKFENKSIHGGSSIMAFDQNCDQLIDLLIGDGKTNNIKLAINEGTRENAFMTKVFEKYPTEHIDISYFVSTYYVDVNNDGANDLIAVHNSTREGQTYDHIWLYLNEGTKCAPIFKLQTKNWLHDEILFYLSSCRPALSDVNGDGLLDLVLGGHITKPSQELENRLMLFLNIGTLTEPKFKLSSDDYLNFSSTEINYSGRLTPSFGDLDGDGAVDLIVGNGYNKLFFSKNLAKSGQPSSFTEIVNNFGDILIGPNAIPNIFDLDQDGLNDLIVANSRYNITFFKNVGSIGFPQFIADPNHPSNVINLGKVFPDLTLEGDLNGSPYFYNTKNGQKMILGTRSGSLKMYGSISDVSDTFTLENDVSDEIYFGKYVNPVLADINNDFYYELFLGNNSGGLRIFKTDIPTKTTTSIFEDYDSEILISPNPTSGQLTIHDSEIIKIALINSNGALLKEERNIKIKDIQMDMTSLPNGIYILKLYSPTKIITKKVIKI